MEYDELDPEQKRKYDLVKGLIERAKIAMEEQLYRQMDRIEEEFCQEWIKEREKDAYIHSGTVGGSRKDAGDSE